MTKKAKIGFLPPKFRKKSQKSPKSGQKLRFLGVFHPKIAKKGRFLLKNGQKWLFSRKSQKTEDKLGVFFGRFQKNRVPP